MGGWDLTQLGQRGQPGSFDEALGENKRWCWTGRGLPIQSLACPNHRSANSILWFFCRNEIIPKLKCYNMFFENRKALQLSSREVTCICLAGWSGSPGVEIGEKISHISCDVRVKSSHNFVTARQFQSKELLLLVTFVIILVAVSNPCWCRCTVMFSNALTGSCILHFVLDMVQ